MQKVCCASVLVVVVVAAGCTTSRGFKLTHERLVEAAARVIASEAQVMPQEIKRTDREEKGGKLTLLTAPYTQYSKIEVMVDSRAEHADDPLLKVKITTGDFPYSRHKTWEARVQELVERELESRPHGAEAKPTALPPVKASDEKAPAKKTD